MKIKYIIICLSLTFSYHSKVLACHKTGDSNCTPISNSFSNSSDATTNENLDHASDFFQDDKNSDPKGFFNNDPYKRAYIKNNSIGSSLNEINSFRSKEEVKNIISTDINKLSSEDFSVNNVNKISFLLKSIKDTISKDSTMTLSEKDQIVNDVDNLRDTFLKKNSKNNVN